MSHLLPPPDGVLGLHVLLPVAQTARLIPVHLSGQIIYPLFPDFKSFDETALLTSA